MKFFLLFTVFILNNVSTFTNGRRTKQRNMPRERSGVGVLDVSSDKPCDVVVISEKSFLTAAHCLDNFNNETRLYARFNDAHAAGEESFEVRRCVVHPRYERSNQDFDIAVCMAEESLEGRGITRVRLAEDRPKVARILRNEDLPRLIRPLRRRDSTDDRDFQEDFSEDRMNLQDYRDRDTDYGRDIGIDNRDQADEFRACDPRRGRCGRRGCECERDRCDCDRGCGPGCGRGSIRVIIIEINDCRRQYDYNYITDRMICTGAIGDASCHSARNGPLFNDQNELLGISSDVECGQSKQPVVFTYVLDPTIRDFIRDEARV